MISNLEDIDRYKKMLGTVVMIEHDRGCMKDYTVDTLVSMHVEEDEHVDNLYIVHKRYYIRLTTATGKDFDPSEPEVKIYPHTELGRALYE